MTEKMLHKMTVIKITTIEVDAEDYSDAVDRVSDGMGNIIDIDYISFVLFGEMQTAWAQALE